MNNGKSRIDQAFARLRSRGEKGLIAYMTAGCPDAGSSLEILKTLADSGADLIEIGIPFSDPIADGPVIQRASHQALAAGFKLADAFEIASGLRKHTEIPVLFMTYYNPVIRTGLDEFTKKAMASGVDGIIVPDLPVEEDEPLRSAAGLAGLSLIPLAAPTSTDERIKKIAARDCGFIYCVAVTGVTGARKCIATDLKKFTDRVRSRTGRPLALGFGISGPETASGMAAHCDAVVVGSAIVSAAQGGGDLPGILSRVGGLAAGIREAVKKPR